MDKTFMKYKSKILRIADKFIRYENHMAFISAYLKAKKIPKGFKLNFHNNMDLSVEGILRKCSLKIMSKTTRFYKEKVKEFHNELIQMDKVVCSKLLT